MHKTNSGSMSEYEGGYRGDIDIDGTTHYISAEERIASPQARRPGVKYLAISFVTSGPNDMEAQPIQGDGVLFPVDNKSDHSTPDYRGNLLKDGVGYWFSAWAKKTWGDEGQPSISRLNLAIKEREVVEANGNIGAHPSA